MKFEYLIFNLFILLAPLVGVFCVPNGKFPQLRAALIAILCVALPFLFWDHLVTNIWWRFNERFILGPHIGRLPIEEVMFFLIIPWSCLVIWENLKTRVSGDGSLLWLHILTILSVALGVWGAVTSHWYSAAAGAVGAGFGLVQHAWGKQAFRTRAANLFILAVIGLVTLFNGYLTTRPVVLYDSSFFSVRIFTVPLEDYFYGVALVGFVTWLYEKIV